MGPVYDNHEGTNKDDDDRLGFDNARQVAWDSTLYIIGQLLDSEGIRGNLNRTAAIMGYQSHTFAIDTTDSMIEELPLVKAQVTELVNAAIVNGDTPGFVLVTFRDVVSEPFITNDPYAFRSVVNALVAQGGGDCPEMSGAATLRAVKASVQGSRVITYTDATSKDPDALLDAKVRAEADDIRVEVRSTGSCSPIDPTYKELTSGTGGQLFVIQPNEIPQLTPLTTPQLSGDFQPLLIANGVFSGTPRVFTVPIDLSVRHAVFSIASEAAVTLAVTRPSGAVVVAGGPGVTIQNFSTGALVAVNTPEAGTWTFSVSGTGEYSVAVSGNTPLSVSEFNFADYVTIKHPGFYPIVGNPLSGQPATAVSRVEGTIVPITFEMISTDGVPLGTLPLSLGHPDAEEGSYTGTVTLPSQPFRIIARGIDGGFPFQRIVPTLFRAQPVSVFPDTVPDKLTPGTQAVATFYVRNVGPAATFNLGVGDDRGFVTNVSPQTIALQQNEIGSVQVTLFAPLNTVTGSPATTTQLTVSAAVQGQPSLENSAFADINVTSVPPAAASTQYYLHREFSSLSPGVFQLRLGPPDATVLTRTSGNMKGHAPGTGVFGWWETQLGIPGYEGVIPTGSIVTVTLWMNKTTNWGTVFPYATMKVNDTSGAFFCEATGTTPVSTTLSPYTFSCATTQPITMWSTDRLIVFPGSR